MDRKIFCPTVLVFDIFKVVREQLLQRKKYVFLTVKTIVQKNSCNKLNRLIIKMKYNTIVLIINLFKNSKIGVKKAHTKEINAPFVCTLVEQRYNLASLFSLI